MARISYRLEVEDRLAFARAGNEQSEITQDFIDGDGNRLINMILDETAKFLVDQLSRHEEMPAVAVAVTDRIVKGDYMLPEQAEAARGIFETLNLPGLKLVRLE